MLIRVRWAVTAAVAVVCAVPTAADGAQAVAGGVPDVAPLSKGEVQAQVQEVVARAGLSRWSDHLAAITLTARQDGRPVPQECTADWPDAVSGTPQQVARLLAELGRAGWHQVSRHDEARWRSVTLDHGGWRLSVLDMPPPVSSSTDDLFVTAMRRGC
ncbi:hypothetical protein [Actinacidiphila bryophytorum]|uniref:Secreted protein n=1 Tax=Actinacidiphila bryophytorum TaxID=1436133 RepID=A0A9W4GXL2_9ACTN|nr:hypothetical protein [Actinacidiphila bryophytorum]MBM9439195.1 hypothetical protein [Actinacidiphila bryophytorum]MBN6543789.1 hypothetical protein [Actinacidiphila bryophytorum]CAG7620999.1 exported hypothetical protein [Actinacidiphila bryophytorum]